MKTRYCISDGKGQYLSTVNARLSGKNGGRINQSFTERVLDRRSPPLVFVQYSEAEALKYFLQTQLPDATKTYEIVTVTVKRGGKVDVRHTESGLTHEEKGTLT